MKQESKDKFNKKSFTRFVKSFKYCYEGIRYAFYHEQNIFVMMLAAIVVMILGIVLGVTYVESLILVVLIGVTLTAEMLNTAIEVCVNLVTKEIKPEAKVAKDSASGAVGILCIFDFIVGLMIFIPKIVMLFR